MDYRDISINIRKLWLLDSYKKGIITKKEYEENLKNLERENTTYKKNNKVI